MIAAGVGGADGHLTYQSASRTLNVSVSAPPSPIIVAANPDTLLTDMGTALTFNPSAGSNSLLRNDVGASRSEMVGQGSPALADGVVRELEAGE